MSLASCRAGAMSVPGLRLTRFYLFSLEAFDTSLGPTQFSVQTPSSSLSPHSCWAEPPFINMWPKLEIRRKLYRQDRSWAEKFWIRTVTLLLSVLAISGFASAIHIHEMTRNGVDSIMYWASCR